jgi:glutamate N-acetyltransferase/amino-acid N-acetyltransferase
MTDRSDQVADGGPTRTGVTAARGFVAAGVACGVKPSGDPDLVLVATDDGVPVPAAAVFTSNKMTAAPVLTSHAHLTATGGRVAAVVANSGNANAATGAQGRADAEAMCDAVAAHLDVASDAVLVCSTGLIGIPLPIDTVRAGIPALMAARGSTAEHGAAAAEALRTTDTYRKEAVATVGAATVGGMAKGAAMLAPDMATMLAVVTTDADVDAASLRVMLRQAVDASFNVLTVDGCTSTNDTVIVLASGRAGRVDPDAFQAALTQVCTELAGHMAADAEGATKTVRLEVVGAATDAEAAQAARKIAQSQLVKCSWYGADPYWGRLASEAGSAGVAFDPDVLSVSYGGVVVADGGVTVAHDEAAVAAHMAQRDLHITVDLHLGSGSAHVLTNDLTHAYVDENMGTS